MTNDQLAEIARLLRDRNRIDGQIAEIIHRPMTSGHLGEWIASQAFGIELEQSASAKAFDGRFRTGPLSGKTVNVKWYLKREGILDMTDAETLDYYLVMTGSTTGAASSAGSTRPWCIEHVYLFDARRLLAEQRARGVRIGVASSVPNRYWAEAEIYCRRHLPGRQPAPAPLVRASRATEAVPDRHAEVVAEISRVDRHYCPSNATMGTAVRRVQHRPFTRAGRVGRAVQNQRTPSQGRGSRDVTDAPSGWRAL
ncbi:hypothetical protein [Haloechinothrix salitolerans]|uniref:Restriction endonuclease n=1 Tax=Haloechinothrix salitolerans TaxID=926830 RepID=A0ABW2C762_9PSEU